MMSTKRILLANGSRLIREMLHHAIAKVEQLEVVQEISDWEGLPVALKRFDPEWVIVPQPYSNQPHTRIDTCMEEYPAVRFVFLSPHQKNIKMKWKTSCEKEYFDLSLQELMHILEKEPQHT